MMGQTVQQGPGEAFGAKDLGPLVERQIACHQGGALFIALREHFEQKLGPGFGQRYEAQLVDDQQPVFCQLLLEPQQAFLVPGLHQLVDQGGGRDKANGEAFLAGGQTEAQGDMGLAGTAWPKCDDVLAALDVFTTRQFLDQHLVERWEDLEVEAVETFDGGEPGLPDPPLDHAALPVDQFQFGEADKIPHMIDALGGALAGELVILAQEGRQPESPSEKFMCLNIAFSA